jgi:hypothetical protein
MQNSTSATTINQTASLTCGTFNEGGFIQSLSRKGFTPLRCIIELIGNILDAKGKNAVFKVEKDYITLDDDGVGMCASNVGEMFDMYRQNHSNDTSIGVSGLGSKAAMLLLSQNNITQASHVTIYTHIDGGDFLRVDVPWDQIIQKGQYQGSITTSIMNSVEINEFIHHRTSLNLGHVGTSIRFKYNEPFHEVLETCFKLETRVATPLVEQLGYIFGKNHDFNIRYSSYESGELTIPMYDYFGGERPNYYTGINCDRILYCSNEQEHEYILCDENDTYFRFAQNKTGCAKKLTPVSSTLVDQMKIHGEFQVTTGMRNDTTLFDEGNMKMSIESIKTYPDVVCQYDTGYITCKSNKDVIKEMLVKTPIYRNGQYISSVNLDDFKSGSARADPESFMKLIYVRSEVSYFQKSTQNNPMDIAVGIQETKVQHCGNLAKPFERMIAHLRSKKWQQIKDYFDKKNREFYVSKESITEEQAKRVMADEKLKRALEKSEEKKRKAAQKLAKKCAKTDAKQSASVLIDDDAKSSGNTTEEQMTTTTATEEEGATATEEEGATATEEDATTSANTTAMEPDDVASIATLTEEESATSTDTTEEPQLTLLIHEDSSSVREHVATTTSGITEKEAIVSGEASNVVTTSQILDILNTFQDELRSLSNTQHNKTEILNKLTSLFGV